MEEVSKLHPDLQKTVVKYLTKVPPVFIFKPAYIYNDEMLKFMGAIKALQDCYIIERSNRIRLNYSCNFENSLVKKDVLTQIEQFKDLSCKACDVHFRTPYITEVTDNSTYWKTDLSIQKNEKYIIWQEIHYFNVETYHTAFCQLLDKLLSQLRHLV